jgi:hypothetical protein
LQNIVEHGSLLSPVISSIDVPALQPDSIDVWEVQALQAFDLP